MQCYHVARNYEEDVYADEAIRQQGREVVMNDDDQDCNSPQTIDLGLVELSTSLGCCSQGAHFFSLFFQVMADQYNMHLYVIAFIW